MYGGAAAQPAPLPASLSAAARRLKRFRSLLGSEAQLANRERASLDSLLASASQLSRQVANLQHALEGLAIGAGSAGGTHPGPVTCLCASPEPAVPPLTLRRHLVSFGALLTALRWQPTALATALGAGGTPPTLAAQLVLCFLYRQLWLPAESLEGGSRVSCLARSAREDTHSPYSGSTPLCSLCSCPSHSHRALSECSARHRHPRMTHSARSFAVGLFLNSG